MRSDWIYTHKFWAIEYYWELALMRWPVDNVWPKAMIASKASFGRLFKWITDLYVVYFNRNNWIHIILFDSTSALFLSKICASFGFLPFIHQHPDMTLVWPTFKLPWVAKIGRIPCNSKTKWCQRHWNQLRCFHIYISTKKTQLNMIWNQSIFWLDKKLAIKIKNLLLKWLVLQTSALLNDTPSFCFVLFVSND